MKEVLGIWTTQTEGAKFWLAVITELMALALGHPVGQPRNRGVMDILIACVDGLKDFPEAIEAVFPHTEVQLCLVHMVRHSLQYVTWKEREAVAKDLKRIYSATIVDEAEVRPNEFAETWDEKYPSIAKSWRANWVRVIPLFAYSAEIRKAIYTTNATGWPRAIESVNFRLRKLTKIRGSFPNEEAAIKFLYLGLRNITKRWSMPITNWKKALNQLMIKFEHRLTTAWQILFTQNSGQAPSGKTMIFSCDTRANSDGRLRTVQQLRQVRLGPARSPPCRCRASALMCSCSAEPKSPYSRVRRRRWLQFLK